MSSGGNRQDELPDAPVTRALKLLQESAILYDDEDEDRALIEQAINTLRSANNLWDPSAELVAALSSTEIDEENKSLSKYLLMEMGQNR
jgi:hypothetical protein